jgi:nitrite reductase (NADH) large subunit
VIVDDAEGTAERLDAAMQASVDAYRDPWQEGREPVNAGQFRTSLPVLSLRPPS